MHAEFLSPKSHRPIKLAFLQVGTRKVRTLEASSLEIDTHEDSKLGFFEIGIGEEGVREVSTYYEDGTLEVGFRELGPVPLDLHHG